MNMIQRTERIDGTDFVVGTVAHARAVEIRDARLDASYLQTNHRLFEDAQRILRDWSGFKHRNDANLVAFFGSQLVYMRARVERVLHEKLRIREFLPVETGYPRGAQAYGQQVDDERGEAKVGRTIASDAPTVDVESRADFSPFLWFYAEYQWTAEELDAEAYAGVPLLQRKAVAVANAIARQLEKFGRSGSAVNGAKGFLNSDLVTVHTLTFGEHTSTATAAEMRSSSVTRARARRSRKTPPVRCGGRSTRPRRSPTTSSRTRTAHGSHARPARRSIVRRSAARSTRRGGSGSSSR